MRRTFIALFALAAMTVTAQPVPPAATYEQLEVVYRNEVAIHPELGRESDVAIELNRLVRLVATRWSDRNTEEMCIVSAAKISRYLSGQRGLDAADVALWLGTIAHDRRVAGK